MAYVGVCKKKHHPALVQKKRYCPPFTNAYKLMTVTSVLLREFLATARLSYRYLVPAPGIQKLFLVECRHASWPFKRGSLCDSRTWHVTRPPVEASVTRVSVRPSIAQCASTGVFVPHIVWLWNIVTAWGMYEFARDR